MLKRKEFEKRKARGSTELKDVKQRTFAKTKYDYSGETDYSDDEEKSEKKFFGLF